jgi:RHS repeat-associated protein
VRIDFPGGGFADYRYDGLGRRIQKDVDGVVTRYVYDREDILLEYDGADVLLARYTHGPGIDDPVILERDLDDSGTFEATERFTYHADGLGSIVALTDSTGAVARAYVYDAYGRIVDETDALANRFTYTGREFDAESGLYFYRARYYDAGLGRFLAEDPIGLVAGDGNIYRYVFDNPTNSVDPTGTISPILGCGIGAVVGGLGAAGGRVIGTLFKAALFEFGVNTLGRRGNVPGGPGQGSGSCGSASDVPRMPSDLQGIRPPPELIPSAAELLNTAVLGASAGCLTGGLAGTVVGLPAAIAFANSTLIGSATGAAGKQILIGGGTIGGATR